MEPSQLSAAFNIIPIASVFVKMPCGLQVFGRVQAKTQGRRRRVEERITAEFLGMPPMSRVHFHCRTLLDFPMRLSHEPGLWIYYKYQYRHVRTTLTWHIRAAARPRHVRPDDTTTHTPPHSPLHSAFQHQILAGARSPNVHDAPENKTRRHSFISNGFTSRAEMPPTGKHVDPIAKK